MQLVFEATKPLVCCVRCRREFWTVGWLFEHRCGKTGTEHAGMGWL